MARKKSETSASPPAVGEGKRGLDGYVGYLLRQAANAQQNRLARALADLDVTPPQFAVLTMIKAYPGVSNADIARLALLTPQTVSVIAGNLVKAGWVARRPHAVHGRIVHLELTDEGRELLKIARKRAMALEAELLDGVGAAEERAVRQWLVDVARKCSAD